MEVIAARPPGPLSRAAPLVAGGALALAAGLVATNDPAAAGSRFPACAFHAATGLWCPGCGLTRGMHQLLTGHPLAALSYNVFTPVVALGLVWLVARWTLGAWRPQQPATEPATEPAAAPRRRRSSWSAWAPTAAVTVVLAYGMLRNLPVPGLRALAP